MSPVSVPQRPLTASSHGLTRSTVDCNQLISWQPTIQRSRPSTAAAGVALHSKSGVHNMDTYIHATPLKSQDHPGFKSGRPHTAERLAGGGRGAKEKSGLRMRAATASRCRVAKRVQSGEERQLEALRRSFGGSCTGNGQWKQGTGMRDFTPKHSGSRAWSAKEARRQHGRSVKICSLCVVVYCTPHLDHLYSRETQHS